MQGKAFGGAFGTKPIYGAGVSLDGGDAAQILGAATDLAKLLVTTGAAAGRAVAHGVGVAAKGAAGLALGILILDILRKCIEDAKAPRFPLASGPIRIDAGAGVQWGIVLDDVFAFKYKEQDLELPFSAITSLSAGLIGPGPVKIVSVDESFYVGVMPKTDSIRIATLAGVQSVKLTPKPAPVRKAPQSTLPGWLQGLDDSLQKRRGERLQQEGYDPDNYYERFRLIPSQVKDLEQLKTSLEFALSNNEQAIGDLIGRDTLRQFFRR